MVGLGMVACYRKLCGTDESPTNNALVMRPAQGQSSQRVFPAELRFGNTCCPLSHYADSKPLLGA